METFYQLLAMMGASLIIWLIYKTIKNRPDQFNREKITHSFYTMGILGIILIIFVAMLILFIRTS